MLASGMATANLYAREVAPRYREGSEESCSSWLVHLVTLSHRFTHTLHLSDLITLKYIYKVSRQYPN